jgi:two-component system, chemotaxis family, sensor kinase Cph1
LSTSQAAILGLFPEESGEALMEKRNESLLRELPDWASDSSLHKFQVREVTQYAMFVLDSAGILLTWNAGVQHILGYSEEEWVGQHASLIFTPPDQAREVCVSEMNRASESGCSSDTRWHRRKDGCELFAHGVMRAIRSRDGSLLGYSKILSDETANKQLQDALTESNMALEQFAYVASHDLQEPLRTVSVYAELLARRYKDQLEGDAEEFLNLIVTGTRRMNALVQDLLTYARVKTEVDRPSSIALDQDIETALTQLQQRIEESNAIVTHDPLPEIQADQGQMVRLFQNLIGNALKYRKPDVSPVIHVSAEQRGSEWVITVRDNGIGFDPKHSKEIFSPFKRLHSQEEYEGTGVGLAICRRIVEGHGGRIWAESQPGHGACFHFSLPVEGKAPSKYTQPVLRD